MSSTATPVGTHPIINAMTQLGSVLDTVADAPVWSLTSREQASVIVDMPRRIAAAQELWLRVLASAGSAPPPSTPENRSPPASPGAWPAKPESSRSWSGTLTDGDSVVLDMGHERRFHTKHMRIAMGIEQRGCTTIGCERPPGWCDAHHELSWSHNRHTSVKNGRLSCGYHHWAHDPAYRHDPTPRRQSPLQPAHMTDAKQVRSACGLTRPRAGVCR